MTSVDSATPLSGAVTGAPAQPASKRERRVLRRFVRQPSAVVASLFLVVVGVLAIIAPLLPLRPTEQDLRAKFAPRSWEHLLGADVLGRDIFSRIIYGGRVSLGTALAVVVMSLLIAIPIGLIAGYVGGRVDQVFMRLTDAMLGVPAIVLALAIAGALGPGVQNTVIALVVIYVPSFIRLVRSETLARRTENYVDASIVAGTRTPRILLRRMLPNVRATLFVASSFYLGKALISEAALSYLGLGARRPTPSWGGMLREAYDSALFTDSWQLIVPGAAIALTVLSLNVVAEALGHAFGVAPRSKAKRGQGRGVTAVAAATRRSLAPAAPPLDRPTGEPAPALDVQGLTIEFATDQGPARVVEDVSFSVAAGEVLGLVGESGSGKTVTGLSIMRLLPSPPGQIVAGSVRFQGTELLSADARALQRVRGAGIAMVFQDPMTSLDPCYTIGSLLTTSYRSHHRVSKKAARARALEMLDLVQIPAAARRIDDYPHQLSGGMRQRVLIAMALIGEPKLLIADEPTTALDVTVQAQVLRLLKDLQTELGMSMLFVTHDLGVVAEMCDRVAVMYAGQIVEQRPVGELFATPRHPYSAALLSSMPTVDGDRSGRLSVITGRVPTAAEMPSGCRFRPRCSFAIDECAERPPILEPVPATGLARCLRAGELDLLSPQPAPVDVKVGG
ncbi:MAG: dipeptide/oligopeptide/nickel ABC transporter permease/ATP-binding protein [Microbacteriaceae bacterium]